MISQIWAFSLANSEISFDIIANQNAQMCEISFLWIQLTDDSTPRFFGKA